MQTLNKKQHNLYGKLCDLYNEHYCSIVSFDTFLRGQENKAYYGMKDEKTISKYYDIKKVREYAENDFQYNSITAKIRH